jgi:hypothetical protein
MQKSFLFWVLIFLFSVRSFGQTPDTSKDNGFDSTAVLKELMALLGDAKIPASYFSVEAGVGNRLFSVHNNRLNARQYSISTLVYTPSVGYFHKSGLSLSAGAYLLNDKDIGFGASQYSLIPSYNLMSNDAFGFSVSYTHLFVKDYFSPYASPIQNDFYTALSYKKTWIEPGIAAGYSTGIYKQVIEKDTTIGPISRRLYDSTTNNLRSFSMMLSASHHFEWMRIFGKDDGFLFTPSVILNFGSYNINVTHKTNAPNLVNTLIKRGRLPKLITSNFRTESLGLNLNCNYVIGDFSFSPQLYLDYYFPETDSDKFTQSFNFSVSYIF